MGLKCQLLGHAYGNPEVERSREEQGDEVVVTVRNVKICKRCGDEQMVNQTKEVTSVRSPEEVGLDTAGASATGEASGDAHAATSGGTDDGDSPVTPVQPEAAPSSGHTDGAVDATVDDSTEPAVGPAAGRIDNGSPGATASASGDDGTDGSREDDEGEETGDVARGADAIDDAESAADTEGWETGSDEWDDVDADTDIDDAVILDSAETERDEVQWPEASDADPAEADSDGGASEPGDDAEDSTDDDAEIIDAGGDAAGNLGAAAGESADSGEADRGTVGEWPEHDGPDEGYSAAPNADVEADFGGNGLTPEVNGSATADSGGVDGVAADAADGYVAGEPSVAGVDSAPDAGSDDGFVRAAEPEASEPDVPDNRIEFYCPNCGYAQTAGVSSMRAGDICPECKRGYIAERKE
jgi:hypothetical protein